MIIDDQNDRFEPSLLILNHFVRVVYRLLILISWIFPIRRGSQERKKLRKREKIKREKKEREKDRNN